MPEWVHTFIAVHPKGKEAFKVGLPRDLWRNITQHGHEVKRARLELVRDVLQAPVEIRLGWARFGTEDCYVYVGKPEKDIRRGPPDARIETPPPPGEVFLVFVLADGSIDEWTWRALAADHPSGVEGHVIWPPNQTP